MGTAAPVTAGAGVDPVLHPATLPARAAPEVRLRGIYDDHLRQGSGTYAGSDSAAYTLDARALAPAAGRWGRAGLAVEVLRADTVLHAVRSDGQGIGGRLSQTLPAGRLAAGWSPGAGLSLGAGWEATGSGPGGHDLWAEAAATLPRLGTVVAWRRIRPALDLDLTLTSADTTLFVPLRYAERVSELALVQPLAGGWRVLGTVDTGDRARWGWQVVRRGGALALRAGARRWPFADRVDLVGDDGSGGDAAASGAWRDAWLAARWRRGPTAWSASARRARLWAGGTGTLQAGDFLSTLDRLLFGRRVFNFGIDLRVRQYQLGVTRDVRRGTVSAGLQWLELAPRAALTHWSPPPLVPLGRLDEQTESLDIRRARYLALGVGVEHGFGGGTLAVALAQLLPVDQKDAAPADAKTKPGARAKPGGWVEDRRGARGGTRVIAEWRRGF